MYVYMNVCTYVLIYVCTYLCVYVSLYVNMYVINRNNYLVDQHFVALMTFSLQIVTLSQTVELQKCKVVVSKEK